jgi:hypothetical protein
MSFHCDSCLKIFTSYMGMWKHKKKQHNITSDNKINGDNKINYIEPKNRIIKKYYCLKCNKEYNLRQSKWKHEKTCNINSKDVQKQTQELETKSQNLTNKTEQIQIINLNKKTDYTIAKFNELNIIYRKPDNYIDGIFMCKKFDKNFEE